MNMFIHITIIETMGWGKPENEAITVQSTFILKTIIFIAFSVNLEQLNTLGHYKGLELRYTKV